MSNGVSTSGTESSLTFDSIKDTILPDIAAAEGTIKDKLATSETLTTRNLMALQIDLQVWSIRSNLLSSVIRVFGDTLRGIVQKIA